MDLKNKLVVSASPHDRTHKTVRSIMLDVIIALVPALIASVVFFGPRALLIECIAVGTCVIFEYASRVFMKREQTVGDLSAVITGLLLAFNLPVSIPLWMVPIGSAVAIVVAKQFFGGIGQNFVNPALIGRIVLLTSFPVAMSTWTAPLTWSKQALDGMTSASPLADIHTMVSTGVTPDASLTEMLLGWRAGCLGETCAIAIIIGGLYLIIRKVISPTIPLIYLGTVALFMLVAGKGDLSFVAYELLGGGLMLGAFFMATDYTTSPITFKGKIIFAIGCGLVTSVIRIFGNLPEGVSYSIILMNILVPLIENITLPKPFGTPKKEKKEKEAKKS
ncbi:MAG: RnfABCDGE type electron transport complex subunit D [Clostridia bacterium]|nr:RnfABCDGE type electron transport complex subunit D [Clostridia bacterium]